MQDGKTILIGIVAAIFFFISFKGCNEDNKKQQRQQQQVSYQKSPVDVLIRDLNNEQNFTIVLYDMDYSEASNLYQHKYNILIDRHDSVYTKETDWLPVNADFFNKNIDNMGMELASKTDGKLSKTVAPAGYSNYVGNEKYGQWVQRDGENFWEFYGKYMFISSMFNMAMFPPRYGYWNDYRTNYYGYGRPYYGPTKNGHRMYGTNSRYAQSNSRSKWNSKSSDFKSRVRNKVSRSTSSNRSSSYRSTSTKKTHSSNRYSSSSYRSRGGSYGK